jgi:hypothetical protein
MVNTSLARIFGRLIVEMEPPITNFDEYVSCASKLSIEDNLTSEKFLVKLDALLNIRSKNMDVMDVATQPQLSLSFVKSVGTSSFFQISRILIRKLHLNQSV